MVRLLLLGMGGRLISELHVFKSRAVGVLRLIALWLRLHTYILFCFLLIVIEEAFGLFCV